MKNLALFLLCMLLLPSAGGCEEGKEIRVIVATDLHYLAPEMTDGGAFFTRLIENSDGKVMAYSEELMEAFTEQVISQRPDALILSGDLTFNGERESHEMLAKKLERIEQAGVEVLVIPGNHDLNSRNAARFEGEGYERVEGVTADEFAAIYRSFGFEGAISRDENSLSYVVELSERLRVLMVDVNTAEAANRVTEKTAAWIGRQLEEAESAGCRIIAVSHQNLLAHSSLISTGFTVDNAEVLLALYADSPVICNLSGHIHMQHMAQSDQGVWDIVTSSLAVCPNQYGVLTLNGEETSYRTQPVDVCAWAQKQGIDNPDLTDFSAYSERFFKESCRRQAIQAIVEDEAPEELAECFAQINAAYFAGRMDLCAPCEQLLTRWQEQASFLARYIESIVQEEPRNHCELLISG